jgi:hypothetical protein
MKLVTLEQLLNNWWRFSEQIEPEEINQLGWDELMLCLNIYCPEAEGKDVIVSDVDMKSFHNPAVSFTLNEE